MSNKAKYLPIRLSGDGKWEIKTRGGKWLKCETQKDATVLSEAPILEESWRLKGRPSDKTWAARLECTAEKLDQYNMCTDARRFRTLAKRAKGSDTK